MRIFVRRLLEDRKIPRPYRAPRPMAFEKDRASAWGRARLELLAIFIAGITGAIAPLRSADDEVRELTLRAIAGRSPSSHVLVVHASPETLSKGTCWSALSELVDKGHARGALLVPPLEAFCTPKDKSATSLSIQTLPAEIVRRSATGAVLGFEAPPPNRPDLVALGIQGASWIVPSPADSVPKLALADVAAGRAPLSVASGRVVVAALASPFEPRSTFEKERDSMGTRVAAALGGLIDGGARTETSRWICGLIGALAIIVLLFVRRIGSLRASLIALGTCVTATIVGQAILVATGRGLLPTASVVGGILAGAVIAFSLDLSGWRRAVTRTSDLLGREGVFRRVHVEPDAVFWPRLGKLAARLFPADFVLVAELPSSAWHLQFWDDGDIGEHLVGERRRDVRRRPFVDDQGVAAPHVVTDFLKNPGEPTVIVPLIALGETEGFIFFCGAKAGEAYVKSPERVDRIARELALVARRRRMSSGGQTDAAPVSRILDAPLPLSERLVQRADVAAKEIATFGEVMRCAPVGLAYADALGDVRLLSRELGKWLSARGVAVPPESPDGALPGGSIHLGQVFTVLTGSTADEASEILSEVLHAETGITCRSEPGMTPAFAVTIRAMRQRADGFTSVTGYVVSVVEQPEDKPTNVRSLTTAPTLDPLGSFPLSEVIAQSVAGTARATGRQVKIEPMRGMGHVIGHRMALEKAFESFLSEASSQSPSAQPPVISVRETSTAVEPSVLDWSMGFGLPESALQRVLIAPGAAPPGLEALGRLIMSVEDSHGAVQIRSEDGWGLTLVVSLLRAKPRVKVSLTEGGGSAVDNVVALGRNTAK